MTGSAHALGDLSYVTVEALLASPLRKIAIVPVGSVEAHGPHLPLSTDTMISEEVAIRAARELASKGYVAVRFPAIAYGVTDWARMFAGTVTLTAATTESIVFETCHAAHAMGFDRVVLTNAHLEPDHIATLRAVAERFSEQTGRPLLFPDKTRRRAAQRLTEEFKSGSCHAGQYETSLVLAIRPDLVDLAKARALPEHVVPLHERIAAGARDFADCGLDRAYCGNPAGATVEEGERSLTTLVALVIECVEQSFAAAPV
jgi:creatinine amidohydrolase